MIKPQAKLNCRRGKQGQRFHIITSQSPIKPGREGPSARGGRGVQVTPNFWTGGHTILWPPIFCDKR